jgi:hypothetical protein
MTQILCSSIRYTFAKLISIPLSKQDSLLCTLVLQFNINMLDKVKVTLRLLKGVIRAGSALLDPAQKFKDYSSANHPCIHTKLGIYK